VQEVGNCANYHIKLFVNIFRYSIALKAFILSDAVFPLDYSIYRSLSNSRAPTNDSVFLVIELLNYYMITLFLQNSEWNVDCLDWRLPEAYTNAQMMCESPGYEPGTTIRSDD